MLELSTYQHLADDAFRRIERALGDLDPDEVDCERAGDVVTITLRGGKKCVANTQRPTRQIWLAANARAWHFSWDEASQRWLDDKDGTTELFAHLASIVRDASKLDVTI